MVERYAKTEEALASITDDDLRIIATPLIAKRVVPLKDRLPKIQDKGETKFIVTEDQITELMTVSQEIFCQMLLGAIHLDFQRRGLE